MFCCGELSLDVEAILLSSCLDLFCTGNLGLKTFSVSLTVTSDDAVLLGLLGSENSEEILLAGLLASERVLEFDD